jgi:endonuclease YncB( thermonuclease family)
MFNNFNVFNIFNSKDKIKKNSQDNYQDKNQNKNQEELIKNHDNRTLNHIQKINIDSSEKKKFNLDNIKGDFYVESVYDGDTITVIVPVKTHIYNMISSNQIDEQSDNNKSNIIYFNTVKLRLMGIDTPEMKPPKDMVGRDEHIKKAKEAKEFLSEQILGQIINIEFLSNDKYGRPLAKIYKNNICLNDLMVEKGYAKKYDGGTKDTNF